MSYKSLKVFTFFGDTLYFLAEKSFLNIKKISLVLVNVLDSSQMFLQKRQENFSWRVYFVLRNMFQYFLDLRTYFSNQENASQ